MKSANILVVEDYLQSAELLQTLLEGYGYRVHMACNGIEALSQMHADPPDLVITDLLMPLMDRYTLLRKVRTEPSLRHIPFIVYTATYTDAKDESLAYSLGAAAFLVKPTEAEPLMDCVRAVLAGESRSPKEYLDEGDTEALLGAYAETVFRKLEQRSLELVEAEQRLAERERVIAEQNERLRQSESRYRSLFENEHTVMLIIDPQDGSIVDANPASVAFYGWTKDQLCRMRISDINTLSAAEIQFSMAAANSRARRFFQFEHRLASGEVRSVEVFSGPIVQAGKNYLYSIVSDVTERKQMEKSLLQIQRWDSVGTLAGGIAHDLNNILSPILMAVDVLAQHYKEPELMEMLATIRSSATRGAELIRKILAFARGTEGEREPLCLPELIGEMPVLLGDALPKHIRFRSLAQPGLWRIHADRIQISQVLLNLILNARDAMPAGGDLTVNLRNARFGELAPALRAGLSGELFVIMEITDAGHGIDDAHLEHIFDPFFTTKPAGTGTGLGLPTVLGIIRSHGGSIAVSSDPACGTCFTVCLPALSEPEAAADPPFEMNP